MSALREASAPPRATTLAVGGPLHGERWYAAPDGSPTKFVAGVFDASKQQTEHVYRQHTFRDLDGQPCVLVHESVRDDELLARYAEAVATERDVVLARAVALLEQRRRSDSAALDLCELVVQCGGNVR